MDLGSQSFIVLLLYLHKSWGINVDIGIAEFQSQDAFDFIPALPCLSGLVDECVGNALWFGHGQTCVAFHQDVSNGLHIHEQSSNFEESCPSNVGISWSMVVVRLDSLCFVIFFLTFRRNVLTVLLARNSCLMLLYQWNCKTAILFIVTL